MTDKERAEQLAAENAKLKADLDKAASGIEAAVKADRDRREAIMGLDESKGREALAEHLFSVGNTVEQAKATLAVSPKEKGEGEEEDSYRPRRTMNAQGLNKSSEGKPSKDRTSILSASVDRANKRR